MRTESCWRQESAAVECVYRLNAPVKTPECESECDGQPRPTPRYLPRRATTFAKGSPRDGQGPTKTTCQETGRFLVDLLVLHSKGATVCRFSDGVPCVPKHSSLG